MYHAAVERGDSFTKLPTVLNLVSTFLPLSEHWIYDQAAHVERYRVVFASRHLRNLKSFPFADLHSVARLSLPSRLWDRSLRRRRGYSPFFVKTAKGEGADIIHAHFGRVAAEAVGVAQAVGVPLVSSFYGVDMWKHVDGIPGLRRKYANVFAHGSVFLVEGPAAGAQLGRIGCDPNKIVVHRLGVKVDEIPMYARTLLRGTELRVLMASRFVEKKGLRYGVEAFARVARDHPNIELTIVGKGTSARERRIASDLRSIARHHGVAGQIHTKGFVPLAELQSLAYRHHVLLHPSIHAANGDAEGGHPVVMTLLAATGIPVLATRHCDIPEIVKDGKTGWLVNEKDVDGLERILRDIIRDPAVLPDFGKRSRELVVRNYDLRKNRLDEIYDGVLSKP